MSKALRHIVAALLLALCLCSCGRDGKVIPKSKFARLYAEMFLADTWLAFAPSETRTKADTMAFYEPIFEKYGYTVEDYWSSVSYYLQDPDRFSRILKKSSELLEAEVDAIRGELESESARNKRRAGLIHSVYDIYGVDYDEAVFTDRLLMQKDSTGKYIPMPFPAETLFLGPRLIVASDTVETPDVEVPVVNIPEVRTEPARELSPLPARRRARPLEGAGR